MFSSSVPHITPDLSSLSSTVCCASSPSLSPIHSCHAGALGSRLCGLMRAWMLPATPLAGRYVSYGSRRCSVCVGVHRNRSDTLAVALYELAPIAIASALFALAYIAIAPSLASASFSVAAAVSPATPRCPYQVRHQRHYHLISVVYFSQPLGALWRSLSFSLVLYHFSPK